MEAAGAPKLTVFLKTFSVPAGNTISVLMFTTFRQVKIQLTPLPEADRIQIVCCQIAIGSKSNTFSGPTRSISCPWIVTAIVFPPFSLIAPLRKYRSCSIGKEGRGFHFVVPFSGRSRMVSKELVVGLMGFPLCLLNLPVSF